MNNMKQYEHMKRNRKGRFVNNNFLLREQEQEYTCF